MAWDIKLPSGVHFVPLEETQSTNADAMRLAKDGAPHLTLVVAKRQTAGRGRYERRWISPDGNVFWSILIRPHKERPWPSIETLPFVIALSVRDALAHITLQPTRIRLKWPNDTLLDGKKVSGVLLQSSGLYANLADSTAPSLNDTGYVVIGVGVNVLHHPSEGVLFPATSLYASGFITATREQVIADLTDAFLHRFNSWLAGGYSAIRDDVVNNMAGIGGQVTVRLSNKSDDILIGCFCELNDSGHLVLRLENGDTRYISSGDVFFSGK